MNFNIFESKIFHSFRKVIVVLCCSVFFFCCCCFCFVFVLFLFLLLFLFSCFVLFCFLFLFFSCFVLFCFDFIFILILNDIFSERVSCSEKSFASRNVSEKKKKIFRRNDHSE